MKDVLSCITVGNGLLKENSSVLYIQFVKACLDVVFCWRALLNEPLDNVKMVVLACDL